MKKIERPQAADRVAAGLIIATPLYRAPELVQGLIESLIGAAKEISALGGRVVLINDSPGFEPLTAELTFRIPKLAALIDLEVITNAENLGFVGSANLAFGIAHAAHADLLLLNSDAILTPGALTEMAQVSRLDPLTAVVSPRSNNATICNSPYPDRFRQLDPTDALAAHQALSPYLPRMTFVPTAVGFCLYVRWLMIEEFGVFDPIFGGGYNEENDFILRCNRRGYRAVLANHAFVFHMGSISFNQSEIEPAARESKNRQILLERYPEYERAVSRYFNAIEFKAQSALAGLVPGTAGRRTILFDANNIGPSYNGTFELAVKMIRAFAARHRDAYDLHIACSRDALKFHGLDQIDGLTYCAGQEREMAPFAAAIRLAQPFAIENLISLSDLAPVTSFLILDTIAMDCQNLDHSDLGCVWSHMLQTTPVVGYISEFSRDQFHRRFQVPEDICEFVALCSTDPADYRSSNEPLARPEGGILLVGNHYSHKHVLDTVARLVREDTRPSISVLGLDVPEVPGVTSVSAGEIPQAEVDGLYDRANVVLFPSHYEGFGFPIMHALSRQKPVIARDLPVFHEIRAQVPGGENIHLFATTGEMADAALNPPVWIAPAQTTAPHAWTHALQALEQALVKAWASLTYQDLMRRLLYVETCRALEIAQAKAARPSAKRYPAFSAPMGASVEPISALGAMVGVRSRKIFEALARLPGLRAVARSAWRRLPQSRVLTADLSGGLMPAEKGGLLRATALGEDVTPEQIIEALLEWADSLVLGGEFELISAYRPEDTYPLTPMRSEGLEVWMRSTGFALVDLTIEGSEVHVKAVKTSDWTAMLPGPANDEDFINVAFLGALGRPAEGFGAIHSLQELQAGKSRREVLKRLYASLERGFAHHEQ